jgi:hypothetical protein
MTVDCQWIEKNLEALFCDRLNEEESRLARSHIDNCAACGREARALNAIDPLIKSHFQRELEIARRPRVFHRARVFGLAGVAASVAIVLFLVLIRPTNSTSVVTPTAGFPTETPVVSNEPTRPVKEEDAIEIKRAKPEPSSPVDRKRQPPLPPVTANSPDFLVTDPAGYSHTLDEYRGRVVLIAVWSQNQTESIANIERLHRANSTNPKFRLIGVSTARQPKPANTTFPIFYNEGSKLFGAQPGEFVLLDENGTAELRGSLTKDVENLRKILQSK